MLIWGEHEDIQFLQLTCYVWLSFIINRRNWLPEVFKLNAVLYDGILNLLFLKIFASKNKFGFLSFVFFFKNFSVDF